jgi:hypothetical protein
MITLDDRLDDLRREKGEPNQPADIVFGEALALPDLGHGGRPARHQIIEPAVRPGDSFQYKIDVVVSLAMACLGAVQQGQVPCRIEFTGVPRVPVEGGSSSTNRLYARGEDVAREEDFAVIKNKGR